MTLIFGGAYQGKLAYAQHTYGPDLAVAQCREENAQPDLSASIINGYHLLVLAQLRKGVDPCAFLESHWNSLCKKIILCDDISCGVVPVDAEIRHWREVVGRCMGILSKRADQVVRVFCGIGLVLK